MFSGEGDNLCRWVTSSRDSCVLDLQVCGGTGYARRRTRGRRVTLKHALWLRFFLDEHAPQHWFFWNGRRFVPLIFFLFLYLNCLVARLVPRLHGQHKKAQKATKLRSAKVYNVTPIVQSVFFMNDGFLCLVVG